MKCALRRWERDVHDRRVEHDHQLRQADHYQDPPPPLELGTVAPHDGRGAIRCHRLCGHEDSLVTPVLSSACEWPESARRIYCLLRHICTIPCHICQDKTVASREKDV